jgi:hypothetical protein
LKLRLCITHGIGFSLLRFNWRNCCTCETHTMEKVLEVLGAIEQNVYQKQER